MIRVFIAYFCAGWGEIFKDSRAIVQNFNKIMLKNKRKKIIDIFQINLLVLEH
jgi:hypothetical protein